MAKTFLCATISGEVALACDQTSVKFSSADAGQVIDTIRRGRAAMRAAMQFDERVGHYRVVTIDGVMAVSDTLASTVIFLTADGVDNVLEHMPRLVDLTVWMSQGHAAALQQSGIQ